MLKGQCDGCLVDFVFCAIYASLLAMKLVKLTVNDKTSALCKKNIYIHIRGTQRLFSVKTEFSIT